MLKIDEIEKALSEKFVISDEPYPRTYIFPDGKFLQIPKYGYVHLDVNRYLDSIGMIPEEYKKSAPVDDYLESLGVIRANLEREGFILLSKVKPTSAQYDSLIEFLDSFKATCFYSMRDKFFLIEPKPEFTFHGFDNPRSISTDEVIEAIKRYYVTGVITEEKENK